MIDSRQYFADALTVLERRGTRPVVTEEIALCASKRYAKVIANALNRYGKTPEQVRRIAAQEAAEKGASAMQPNIILKPVESSNIKAIGWDGENQILVVQFNSGTYQYPNVPKEVYEAFLAADSIGKHFHAVIRPHYAGIKVAVPETAEKGATTNGNELELDRNLSA